jgi:succinyl-diaminopimelate desuccinylase
MFARRSQGGARRGSCRTLVRGGRGAQLPFRLAAPRKKPYKKRMDVREKLRRTIEGKRQAIIDLQRDLTAVPALAPQNGGDGESKKAQVLSGWLERLGLGPVSSYPASDPRVPTGERPNLLARLPGKSADGTFWIMSHMDIVPPGEPRLWTSDPYTLVVKGDRLVGRGVEDNQQGLVASVFAAVAVKELGLVPARTVGLLFVADEETGSELGIQHLVANTDLFGPRDRALVPDSGAPDGSCIEVAEKSLYWLRFRIRGRQCHASTPEKGINAFAAGSNLVVRLSALSERFPARDPLFAPPVSTFTPTKKEANVPNINTIPGEDVFYLDCRVLPREDLDEVMAAIRGICGTIEADFGVTVDIEEVQKASSPPTSVDAPLVSSLKSAIHAVYGVQGVPIGIGGGTVGAFLRKKGIPTVVWSRLEEMAHQPNEYCLLGNLVGDALVMALLMLAD